MRVPAFRNPFRAGLPFLALGAALALAAASPARAEGPGNPAPASAAGAVMVEGVPGVHALALYGDVKYPPGFRHFAYANPDAPKGGLLRLAVVGDGYDSFNIVPPRGATAAGLGMIYESLMAPAGDEAFTQYGLLAETAHLSPDGSWVAFRLRENARWQDGLPVTADDVVWSFNTFREKGEPLYRHYYRDVTRAEALDSRTVRFWLASGVNRELPLILGQLTVLPRHDWEDRDITRTGLTPPLGSGPYRIADFEPNRFVTYERVPDYWGAQLGVNRGRYNFDRIRYDYYGDDTVALEAFKADEYDIRVENIAKNWALGYDGPALADGRIIKQEFPDSAAKGMQGFVFNMRRGKFADPRVRQALAAVFDFDWSNRTFFFGQYRRARSFFNASELEATGVPEGEELALLSRFRADLPPALFTQEYNPPAAGEPGQLRRNLLRAADMLDEAGWTVDPESLMLRRNTDGAPFHIEFLLVSVSFQRVVLPVVRNLRRLGIDASIRVVDSSQYIERIRNRDFDIIIAGWGQSLSPGNEQREYWGSAAADRPGSRNYGGLKNPAVDGLVDLLVAAPTRHDLVIRTRALDRALQWQHLVIPQYYSPSHRVAYWNRFGIPEERPLGGYDFMSWWVTGAEPRTAGTADVPVQPEGNAPS